jgi:hypothetical protein
MQVVTGIWRDVLRNTVSEEFRKPNAVFHRNLDTCNAIYGNVSEEFRNTELGLSLEFREI